MKDFNLKKYLAENKLLVEKDEFKSTGFAQVDAILKDVDDKLPQFKTVDTAPEFLALVRGIIERVMAGAPDFVESGRFIQAMVQLYSERKDISKAAKNDDFDLSSNRESDAKMPKLGDSYKEKPLSRRQKIRQQRDQSYVKSKSAATNAFRRNDNKR
tara:strand:+ start:69 stop:539 length:471 start_codon:yes stop_codon:yes gene_type:complete